MKRLILTGLMSSVVIISGFTLAMAGTDVEFKFQSSPTGEQIFKAAGLLLRHYRFDIRHEDAQASLSIPSPRSIPRFAMPSMAIFDGYRQKVIPAIYGNLTPPKKNHNDSSVIKASSPWHYYCSNLKQQRILSKPNPE